MLKSKSPLSFEELLVYCESNPTIVGVDPDSSLKDTKTKSFKTLGSGVYVMDFDTTVKGYGQLVITELVDLFKIAHPKTILSVEHINNNVWIDKNSARRARNPLQYAAKQGYSKGTMKQVFNELEFYSNLHNINLMLFPPSAGWKNNKNELESYKAKNFETVTGINCRGTNEEIRSAAWFAYKAYHKLNNKRFI